MQSLFVLDFHFKTIYVTWGVIKKSDEEPVCTFGSISF